jgi:VanZ family protein
LIRKSSPFLYVYLYAAAILIGHSIPGVSFYRLARMNRVFRVVFSDKFFHFFLFGFFAWLLCFGYTMARREKIPYIKIFLLSLGYGALIEAWQALLPYRHFDERDLMFDALGIVLFMVSFWLMRKFGTYLRRG